jgi:hypothetical protein
MSAQVVDGQLQKRYHWVEEGLLQSRLQQEFPTVRSARGFLSLSQLRNSLLIVNVALELAV